MPAATVYTCRVTNWPILWLSIFCTVVCIFNVAVSDGGALFLFVVVLWCIVLVKAVVQASQRVSAGPVGLAVNLGPFGFPRVTVARANIARAEIIDMPVTLRSRWGVYWTRKRGWFFTPNMGPALRLHLTNGRNITVAMPEPAAAIWAMGIAP
ncbi:hypothetical protein [Nocardia sp. NPDC050175]|uniref:hypothetical protein n=1 Tax=Nocardia sp. NPDC050175 TaxID=3364317 RepID=UPI00378AA88D